MVSPLAKAVIWIGAAAVLFALVCPLAPTPRAVGKVKRAVDGLAPLPMPLPAIVASPFARFVEMFVVAPAAVPAEITDLFCVRTC